MSNEAVNHPTHYHADSGVEVIEAIKAWSPDNGLSFMLGNVIKYCARAGHKSNMLEDLKKAEWYIQSAIKVLEEKGKSSSDENDLADEIAYSIERTFG